MATNNSINKTCDTFTATTSVVTPSVTTSAGDLTLSPFSGHIFTPINKDIRMSYSSDNSGYHTIQSLAGGIQIDDGYVSGSATLSVPGLLANTLTSIGDLTLATASSNTDIILNAIRNINLNPGSSQTVTIGNTGKLAISNNITITGAKLLVGVTSSANFFEGRITGDTNPVVKMIGTTGAGALFVGEGGGNTLGTYLTYDTLPGEIRFSQNQDGTGAAKINTVAGTVKAQTFSNSSSSFTLDGTNLVLGGSTGITFPTSGGTATALTYNERYTNTVALSGIWASSQNATINITRTATGVKIWLGGGVLATANTASDISAPAGSIPTRFVGSNEGTWSSFIRMPFNVRDNGTDKAGTLTVYGNGAFQISVGASTGGAFAGSGSSGFPGQGFGWSL